MLALTGIWRSKMTTCAICLEDFEPTSHQLQMRGHTTCVLLETSQERKEALDDMEMLLGETTENCDRKDEEIRSLVDANQDLNTELSQRKEPGDLQRRVDHALEDIDRGLARLRWEV